ncbi:unnamed protein product [Colias eurytheme]|nr:unnamed protein product [Colias eurytheme]
MTPKIAFVGLLSILNLLDGYLCGTYSNVFVRGGSEVLPLEYINYGGPVAYGGPQIAQISAAPIESVVSLQNALNPCVAPCVINAPIPALAPIGSTANAQIVAYKPPVANVPVVLANKDDTFGYQYSYAVYDDGTGDKKTQSEQSDGSVVQGQYSFIQPDGYRRDVVYTADDLKGFNAIVKTVSPEPEDINKDAAVESVENKDTPCKEQNKEQLVEAPKSDDKTIESLDVTEAVDNNDSKSEEKSSEEVPTPTTDVSTPSNPEPNVVVSYSDFVNCLQSKRIAGAKNAVSPLTYILIPSLNGLQKSC